jgi:hypothetical protein
MARPAGLEPATLGLAYHYCFHSLRSITRRLWSGLSLHPLRCCTYSLYGTPRCAAKVFTCSRIFSRALPSASISNSKTSGQGRTHSSPIRSTRAFSPVGRLLRADHRFPRDCHQLNLLRFPRYGAVHCSGSVSRHRLLTQRPMLYPVELRAHAQFNPTACLRSPPRSRLKQTKNGRGRGIRTPDPLLPKQMRYQAAPCPDCE